GLVKHFTSPFMQSRPLPHREASPGGFTYRPLRSRHRTTDAPEARPSLLLLTKTQRTTTFSAPDLTKAQKSPEAGTALGTQILYNIFIFVWGGQPPHIGFYCARKPRCNATIPIDRLRQATRSQPAPCSRRASSACSGQAMIDSDK